MRSTSLPLSTASPAPLGHTRRAVVQAAALLAPTAAIPARSSPGAGPQAGPAPGGWSTADIPPQSGRRVLVTGGNGFPQQGRSGLGYHVALALAQAGADVTIASRQSARGEEAVRMIRAQVPAASVRFEPLDLTSPASVQAFAARRLASGRGLDVLVNNAGVMGRPQRELTPEGFERVFATNTLGHFTLTALLLPLLRQGQAPRVVWVSSLRASDGRLDLADLQMDRRYDYAAAYDNSKLALLLLSQELARRSAAQGWGVASVAAHPGVARTNLIPDGPGLDSREGLRLRMLPFLFQPAAQGALPLLFAATDPQARSGGYHGPAGLLGLRGAPGPATLPEAAQDEKAASALWAALEQLTRLKFGEAGPGPGPLAQQQTPAR